MPPTSRSTVRPATAADLTQLNDLYNHYVRETPITFDIEPITPAQRQEWFTHYDTAGRIRKGPAPKNLEVPPYQFLDDQRVRFG